VRVVRPVTPERKTTMRYLLLLCLLILIPLPVFAQQGFSVGLAYNQNGDPAIQGWGTYDRAIQEKLYSYSGYDVLPLWQEGAKVPQLKFTAFTGLAYQVAKLNWLTLWIQGAGGMATTGDVTTGMGNYGGFAHCALGKGWGFIAGGQGSYSPIAGTDAILRFGFRYGVK
jgi:hypothetical protein